MTPDFFVITLSDVVGVGLFLLIVAITVLWLVVAVVRRYWRHFRTRNTPVEKGQCWRVFSGECWITEIHPTHYACRNRDPSWGHLGSVAWGVHKEDWPTYVHNNCAYLVKSK